MSLFELPIGTTARIAEIQGGQQLTRRLLGLGLRAGSEVAILHHRNQGLTTDSGRDNCNRATGRLSFRTSIEVASGHKAGDEGKRHERGNPSKVQ